jgi:hypothetical protein
MNLDNLLDESYVLTRKDRMYLHTRIHELSSSLVDYSSKQSALIHMLGPKGLEVWELWQKNRVKRVHFYWGDEADTLDGEGRAEVILEWDKAIKTKMDDIDKDLDHDTEIHGISS